MSDFTRQLKQAKNNKYQNKEVIITSTRPDIIKFAPLLLKLKDNAVIIHTGQHSELADEAFNVFQIRPDFNLHLMTQKQDLIILLSKLFKTLNLLFKTLQPKRVWVQGDTCSAYGASLVASMLKIPIIHLEAGLRSFDKNQPWPEEIFRTQIDNIADIMFAPTIREVENLKKENLKGKIYLVGNTIVDVLMMIKPKLPKERPIKEKYILATVHRRESFGIDILHIFEALKEISKTIRLILPAHPNPNVQKVIKKVGLDVVKPMNYIDFLWHLRDCEYVISDSGGVQEEAPSFGKKVIVLRKTTERQEMIERGYGILIKKMDKNYILNEIKKFSKKHVIINKNPFGDGKTSDRIIKILEKNEKKT